MNSKINKDDIEHSITILSGLLGYSERMGIVSDINEKMYCKKDKECPATYIRMSYEAALKTAIEVLNRYSAEN